MQFTPLYRQMWVRGGWLLETAEVGRPLTFRLDTSSIDSWGWVVLGGGNRRYGLVAQSMRCEAEMLAV